MILTWTILRMVFYHLLLWLDFLSLLQYLHLFQRGNDSLCCLISLLRYKYLCYNPIMRVLDLLCQEHACNLIYNNNVNCYIISIFCSVNPFRLIGVGLSVWTLATLCCGLSFDFWSITFCRMLVFSPFIFQALWLFFTDYLHNTCTKFNDHL